MTAHRVLAWAFIAAATAAVGLSLSSAFTMIGGV